MPAAFIEHRPHASSEHVRTSHYVIVVNGTEATEHLVTRKQQRTKPAPKAIAPSMLQENGICRTGRSLLTGVSILVEKIKGSLRGCELPFSYVLLSTRLVSTLAPTNQIETFYSMELSLLLIIGIFIGCIIGWLWTKFKLARTERQIEDRTRSQFNELEKEYVGHKATSAAQLQHLRNEADRF